MEMTASQRGFQQLVEEQGSVLPRNLLCLLLFSTFPHLPCCASRHTWPPSTTLGLEEGLAKHPQGRLTYQKHSVGLSSLSSFYTT